MKKVILTSLITLVAAAAFAGGGTVGSDSDHYTIAKKLASLNGKTGVLVETYDNSARAGSQCILDVTSSSDGTGYSVRLNARGMYFTPVAHVTLGTVSVLSESSLLVQTNSNRPGGDACGDWGGAVNYKKVLTVDGNSVTISESFRCGLEAFKKYDLVTTCKF